ncbi:MAG: TonB-dependent receptor [Mariniblastus sp.]
MRRVRRIVSRVGHSISNGRTALVLLAAIFLFFSADNCSGQQAVWNGASVVGGNPGPGLGAQPRQNSSAKTQSLNSDARVAQLFGAVNQVDGLSSARRPLALSPGANAVFSAEATGRKTSDIGSLLQASKSAQGVSIQKRTPIVSDTRIRGQRVGQVLASGSFWGPARMDLDSMMSKIDSRLIEDVILVKGPYAARYGAGFRFVDMDFKKSPRYSNNFHTHGSTSLTYNTNGQQFNGRQTIEGADQDMGFLFSYGHQTGNDYETGQADFFIPSSYKSRDLFGAIGVDISASESLEFNIIRLDQTDIEFPGLVYDLDYLVTDGYELTYTNNAPAFGDHLEAEVWYNRTRFAGDTLRAGKNVQIPDLRLDLQSASGVDGFAITDGDALSGGYRIISTYETNLGSVSFGTDLNIINQELNDIEPAAPVNDNNFPIPRSVSVDVGAFVESVSQVTPQLTRTAGARIDGVFTDSEEFVPGVPDSLAILKDSPLDQDFLLGSAYLTMDYKLTESWNLTGGLGTSHRAPTLTELYSEATFIGSLQRGLTFLGGDPQLDAEKLYQVDLGTSFKTRNGSFGFNAYHSWINDYITYDLSDPAGAVDGFQVGAEFVNTDLATIAGLEAYGQYQVAPLLSMFGVLSAVEGRDHSRDEPARLTGLADRSAVTGVEHEPLPGINPLEAKVGFLFQDPDVNPLWGVEFMARIVDTQDRVARTLGEIETPGFTTFNIRSYRRIGRTLVTAGVENLTDEFYREHVDYRSGRGVFQPGIGFYLGTEVSY